MKSFNRNPSGRDIRQFGLVIFVGFGLLGALLIHRHHVTGARWLWVIAGVTGLLSLFLPRAARPLYRLWMTLGELLGAVMSRIVMFIIFYGLITPLALIFRWTGRDALALKRRTATSYWSDLPETQDPERFERLS